MYKKLFASLSIILAFIFATTFCFANDAQNMVKDAANDVRNAVGGAENTVENAAKDVGNGVKNITNGMENGAQNVTNNVRTDTQNATGSTYNATRTATDTTGSTFMGMNATMWTWVIMGIAAIAIVALVWYYGTQLRSSNYDDRD